MDDSLKRLLEAPCPLHFVGIGGVGMAGLARLFMDRGFRVSGSDTTPNALTLGLQEDGARVYAGHAARHVPPDVCWAVRTPAVVESNPELEVLRRRHLPVFARGELLAAYAGARETLAVAGAHGKTTTAAMLAHMLRETGEDCGYAIGGETHLPGRVAHPGTCPLFVCEADESDGTLARYTGRAGVLTHVEWDHVERFPTAESLWACYRRFASRCGVLLVRSDDPVALGIAGDHPNPRILPVDPKTLRSESDPGGQNIRWRWQGIDLETRLPLPGRHNAVNAALALAAACEAGADPRAAWASLETFRSVGRRFERRVAGGVTVIHDYAHHPTEISALLDAVSALRPRRVVAAFQPHRYSRTRHLLDGFADALAGVDSLHLLPVYAASESPALGVDSDALAARARELRPGFPVRLHGDMTSLLSRVLAEVGPEDAFVVIGAGDIVGAASLFIEQISKNRVSHV